MADSFLFTELKNTNQQLRKLYIHTLIQTLVFVLLIMIDRVSKHAVSVLLKHSSDKTVIKGVLDLHYLENTGAAFGLFDHLPWLFYVIGGIAAAVLAAVFCLIFYRLREKIREEALSRKTVSDRITINYLIAVLAAGTIGNLIDRILYGYVIDFLCIRFISFPVFNAADIFITVSIILLFLFLLFVYKEDSNFRLSGNGKKRNKR